MFLYYINNVGNYKNTIYNMQNEKDYLYHSKNSRFCEIILKKVSITHRYLKFQIIPYVYIS